MDTNMSPSIKEGQVAMAPRVAIGLPLVDEESPLQKKVATEKRSLEGKVPLALATLKPSNHSRNNPAFDCPIGVNEEHTVIHLEEQGKKKPAADEKDSRCYSCAFWLLVVAFVVAATGSAVLIAYSVKGFQSDEKAPLLNGSGSGDQSRPAQNGLPFNYSKEEREEYYALLLRLHGSESLIPPQSVVAKSLEWMAFEDVPIPNVNTERFWQRFALIVWYFEQGGPTLWSRVNANPSSGWILHGIGRHECDWHGIDCDENRNVTGVRLGMGTGITMTGVSLSTELGALTRLNRLDLENHRLKGSIPREWSALTNLGK